jgi:hypothetical protein
LAPPVGSQPPPRWAWGHCRYHVDRVPPHISFVSRKGAGHASTCCHIPCSFRLCLPIEVGSSAAAFPTTPDLVSLPRWALALPCVPRPQTSPPCRGGLQCCLVSHSPTPRLPIEMGSSIATCPMAPDLASLLRWALALPHVPRCRTSPPY